MIVIDTMALLILEVSIKRVAPEICFFQTVVCLCLLPQLWSLKCQKWFDFCNFC